MATYTYDNVIKRQTVLELKLWLPEKAATSIATPSALVAGDVVEISDNSNLDSEGGNGFSVTTADTVNFHIVYYGVDTNGREAVSAPSPVYAHTVVGATVVGFEIDFDLVPTAIPAGVVAVGLLMELPDGDTPRLVDWKPVGANGLITYRKPTANAPTLAEFTASGKSLIKADPFTIPAVEEAPSVTYTKMLNEFAVFNGQNVTQTKSFAARVEGVTKEGDIRFEQLLNGGGQFATGNTGKTFTGIGSIQGFCNNNIWVSYFEGSNSCGKLHSQLFLATFAVDETAKDKSTGNIPFTLTQQDFPFVKGVYPVTGYVGS
ncbi:MAG TPA: hypothetical protein V6C96_02025 [Vampirovibrionales bacterium]